MMHVIGYAVGRLRLTQMSRMRLWGMLRWRHKRGRTCSGSDTPFRTRVWLRFRFVTIKSANEERILMIINSHINHERERMLKKLSLLGLFLWKIHIFLSGVLLRSSLHIIRLEMILVHNFRQKKSNENVITTKVIHCSHFVHSSLLYGAYSPSKLFCSFLKRLRISVVSSLE